MKVDCSVLRAPAIAAGIRNPQKKIFGDCIFTQTEDNKGIERRGEMTIMKFEIIEDYITQFPIYQYALLDTRELEFTDKVRTICKKNAPAMEAPGPVRLQLDQLRNAGKPA